MRFLITGGAGFIGSNLAQTILNADDGHEVVVLDDLSTGDSSNLDGLDVSFRSGSILDPGLLDAAADGADSIIHLAAIPSVPRSIANPIASHHANATGTLAVLEAARRSGSQVIVASSSSVYGSNPGLPKRETDWTRPLSPYGVSKLATESYALAYQESYGVDTLAFRFFNVYGPRQAAGHAYAAVIPIFIDAALRGRPLPIDGDGLQSRDFTYVGTVASVLFDAAVRRVTSPSPVNLAFGGNITLLQLIDLLETELGFSVELEHRAPRVGDVRASQADETLLHSLFPQIQPTALQDGVRATVEWFRSVSA